jgi:hypothetical protein
MLLLSPSKSQTLKRSVFIAVILLCSGVSHVAWADCNGSAAKPSDKTQYSTCKDKIAAINAKSSPTESELSLQARCGDIIDRCEGSSSGGSTTSSSNTCASLRDKVDSATSKFTQACADAGIASGCEAKVDVCKAMGAKEVTSSSQSVILNSLAAAFNVPPGEGAGLVSKCSSLSGRDFASQKKELTDKLDQFNKDLKANAEKKVEVEHDYTDAVAELDQKVAEEQKKFQEDQANLPKEQREADEKSAQQLAQAQAARREKVANMAKLNSNQTQMLTNKAQQLEQLVESNATISCYDKAKTMLQAGEKNHANNFSTLASSAGQAVVMAQTVYKTCLADFAAKRLQVIQGSAAALKDNQIAMDNLQSEIDNIDQQVASAIANQNQDKLDSAKKSALAQAAMAKSIELANKKRDALDKNKAAKLKVLDDEVQTLQTKFNSTSNELAMLGAAPAKSSGDGNIQKAYQAYQDKVIAEQHWAEETPDADDKAGKDGFCIGADKTPAGKKAQTAKATAKSGVAK